jgi:hypothetical protein
MGFRVLGVNAFVVRNPLIFRTDLACSKAPDSAAPAKVCRISVQRGLCLGEMPETRLAGQLRRRSPLFGEQPKFRIGIQHTTENEGLFSLLEIVSILSPKCEHASDITGGRFCGPANHREPRAGLLSPDRTFPALEH